MSLVRSMINLLAIITIIVVFQAIMNFLNIELSSYLIYFIWFIALILFYYILPSKNAYAFSLNKSEDKQQKVTLPENVKPSTEKVKK